MGNVFTFTPPLIVTEEQMCTALQIVEDRIADVKRRAGPHS